jgi:hypothetical protein
MSIEDDTIDVCRYVTENSIFFDGDSNKGLYFDRCRFCGKTNLLERMEHKINCIVPKAQRILDDYDE